MVQGSWLRGDVLEQLVGGDLLIRIKVPGRNWRLRISVTTGLLSEKLWYSIFFCDSENEGMVVKLREVQSFALIVY